MHPECLYQLSIVSESSIIDTVSTTAAASRKVINVYGSRIACLSWSEILRYHHSPANTETDHNVCHDKVTCPPMFTPDIPAGPQ